MTTFTAAQVRLRAQMMRDEAADAINDYRLIHREQLEREYLDTAAMLDAFAQRLEAVAAIDTRHSLNTVADYALIQAGREQGQREVLAEILAVMGDQPIGPSRRCALCDGEYDDMGTPAHQPDCLWLRAQQVTP